MTDTLRPLPILTPDGSLPSGWDHDGLRAAKLASGYEGLVLPRQAVQGSPEPILAVGVEPDWLTEFAYVDTLLDQDATTKALQGILIEKNDTIKGDEYLLSKWMGCEVKLIGVESDRPLR